jgi:hypothetical protein
MPLCTPCLNISLEALREGYSHLSDARKLWDSSLTCALCHLIRLSLNNDTAKEVGNALESRYYDTIAKAPIVLYGAFQEEDSIDGDIVDQLKLISIDVHIPLLDEEIDISNLGVYQDESAEHDGCIVGRPSLHEAGGPAAMQLLKMWMQRCNAEHHQCSQKATSRAQSPLPTRVLDISEHDVRLHVSRGECDKYAALSHCWGPDPPIKTLKSNFSSHQRGIRFANLPNTFQQAVKVAKELGLKYIWIDSLCIIQDDKSDWGREALKMGSVYEGAEVTIAATGSTNAHDGCFIPRPTMPDAVPLNISYQGRSINIHVALRPKSALADLQANPLAGRTWITQEWLLSRRTIHFCIGELRWICRTESETETGEAFIDTSGTQRVHDAVQEMTKLGTSSLSATLTEEITGRENGHPKWDFIEEWLDVATTYCRRKLTYRSDKPVALQGIIDVVSRKLGRTCMYGIWDFSIHQQLFWFATNVLDRPTELSTMPSWSWLSTYGKIHQIDSALACSLLQSTEGQEKASVEISDRFLDVYGPVIEYGHVEGPFNLHIPPGEKIYSPSTVEHVKDFQKQMQMYTSFQALGYLRVGSQNFFGVRSKEGKAIGWASFDIGVVPSGNIICLLLAKNDNNPGGEVNFLILQGHDETCDVWKRVGMGELKDDSQLGAATWSKIRIE